MDKQEHPIWRHICDDFSMYLLAIYIGGNPESITGQLLEPEHHQNTACVEALLVGPGRQEKGVGLSG